MEKSTIQTSRKIYALKLSFCMIAFIIVVYAILMASGIQLTGTVFAAAIGSIGAIAGALNIADGMKKGE